MYKRSSQPEMGSELYTAINNSTSTNGNLRSNKSIRPDLQARTAFSENSKVTHVANKIAAMKLAVSPEWAERMALSTAKKKGISLERLFKSQKYFDDQYERLMPRALAGDPQAIRMQNAGSDARGAISRHDWPAPKKTAAFKLDGRTELGTLDISIENKAGTYRHWYDPHNKKAGKTLQKYDYGYIRGSKGMDGDHVDCYVGHNRTAQNVYVVTTNKAPDFSREDEQKCMIGFGSEAEAKKAFLDHYDNPKFFRAIKTISFKDFEKKVLATKDSATKKVAFAVRKKLAAERALFNTRMPPQDSATPEEQWEWARQNPTAPFFTVGTTSYHRRIPPGYFDQLFDRTRKKTAAERDLEEGQVFERPRGLARNSYSRIAPSGDFKNIRGQMDEMFGYMDDDRSTGVME